ncbi:hypothetical protein L7F22_008896 [Adiantum nelumboides]|nr:hypothetical protein [Adiantum nelumboides]
MALSSVITWGRCCIALLLLLVIFFPTISMQQQADPFDTVYVNCLRTSTLSTAFNRNLNTTLRNFISLASQGSKYGKRSTAGREMQLYAVFQCRGDLSAQSCGKCMQNVTVRLPQECPGYVGARLRVNACFLRYDIQSFFQLDTNQVQVICKRGETSDAATLDAIAGVMDNVTGEAPKKSGYWASARRGSMYAAAECLGYLNEAECSACLSRYSYNSLSTCGSALGEQLHLASCNYRYEAYDFLEAAAPPLIAVAAPPPPSSPAPVPSQSSPRLLSFPPKVKSLFKAMGSPTTLFTQVSLTGGIRLQDGGDYCGRSSLCHASSATLQSKQNKECEAVGEGNELASTFPAEHGAGIFISGA